MQENILIKVTSNETYTHQLPQHIFCQKERPFYCL